MMRRLAMFSLVATPHLPAAPPRTSAHCMLLLRPIRLRVLLTRSSDRPHPYLHQLPYPALPRPDRSLLLASLILMACYGLARTHGFLTLQVVSVALTPVVLVLPRSATASNQRQHLFRGKLPLIRPPATSTFRMQLQQALESTESYLFLPQRRWVQRQILAMA